MNFLDGKRTWIGIGVMIIGMTGLVKFITPEQFQALANGILDIIGIAIAIYGNYLAHQKIKELE
jgi:hypothetical protein